MNGDVYDGEWSHHVRHGSGQYTYAANGIVYTGTWENGRRVGTGSITIVGQDTDGRDSAMKVSIPPYSRILSLLFIIPTCR